MPTRALLRDAPEDDERARLDGVPRMRERPIADLLACRQM